MASPPSPITHRPSSIELARVLKGQTVRIVAIVTITRARMRKWPPGIPRIELTEEEQNPFWSRGVQKVALRTGLVGADYARAVIAQRSRERGVAPQPTARGRTSDGQAVGLGDAAFTPQPLWRGAGEHVDQYFARHKATGRRYLKFLPTTDQAGRPRLARLRYQWSDTREEIPEAWLAPWLVAERQPKTQATRRPIRWRTIAVEHVAELRMAGDVYHFLDAATWQSSRRAA